MRPFLLTLLLLAATAAFGQNQAPATKQFPVTTVATVTTAPQINIVPGFRSCPVGMRAQQRGGGQTLWTVSLEDAGAAQIRVARSPAPGTGVHVELGASNNRSFRQVELTVSYLAPGARVVPVGESNAGADRTKTFTLSAAEAGSSKLAGDLLVGAAAGIIRVHVVSIHYIDGTEWHAGRDTICSVEPDRFLPVASR